MPLVFGQLPSSEHLWSTFEAVDSIERGDRGLTAQCKTERGSGQIQISVLAENVVRVRVAPTGEFLPRRSWAVTRDDADWESVEFEQQEISGATVLKTATLQIELQHSTCRIHCRDRQGNAFACDAEHSVRWRPGMIAGWKQMEPDEHFYGFGERTGLLDKRGEVKTNWTVDALDYGHLTDEMYQAIPFFISLRPGLAYGIFLNTTCWSQFDLGAEDPTRWRMESHTSELDYYILYGPDPATILHRYSQLTGRMPLPPKWSLGYHQSRWSYGTEEIVRELAQEFRDRRIPCDVIHLDIDYMRNFRVFTWSPRRFPNPKQLITDLHDQGLKVVTIIDPGVKVEFESDYPVFDQGLERSYFIQHADGKLFHGYVWPDKAVFPDFLRPEVREWWGDWQHCLTDIGIAGIWNDMNEPALHDRPFGDKGDMTSFPLDAPQGPIEEQTTHAEGHNLYGYMMAQASAEGLKKWRSTERSFVLTRSGYAGVQRYSSVWMGDNQSNWDQLEMSLPMLSNMGLSGVPFIGCDVGGFAQDASPELFARWIQVGILYPLMRGHSSMGTKPHEPWAFGPEVEDICRTYIELRYRLLPYLYTLFWEASTTGAPILRPLVYHYANDPKTYLLFDQVLLGEGLMAAPVVRPGVDHRAVYLPEGDWYDWWDGTCHHGNTHVLASAPLDRMPLYVKAGSIIPLQPVMQYVDQHPVDVLRLRVFPGNGEWTLYEDDGRSFDYQQGQWATTTYRVHHDGQQITVDVAQREGQWQPPDREVVVEVVGRGEQRFQDDGSERSLIFS